MKKSVLSVFVLLAMIGFASAQGLSDILNQIDASTLLLFVAFIISFAVSFFALNKFFKGNTAISGIVAVAVSFLIVYGINSTGFNLGGFFIDLGISQETLAVAIPILILGAAIFVIVKMKRDSLFIFGGALIVLSFFVFEGSKIILIVAGIILLAVRFFMKRKGGKSIIIK
jgi:hypothetical protein